MVGMSDLPSAKAGVAAFSTACRFEHGRAVRGLQAQIGSSGQSFLWRMKAQIHSDQCLGLPPGAPYPPFPSRCHGGAAAASSDPGLRLEFLD